MAFLNLNKRIAYIDNKKIILRSILKYESHNIFHLIVESFKNSVIDKSELALKEPPYYIAQYAKPRFRLVGSILRPKWFS